MTLVEVPGEATVTVVDATAAIQRRLAEMGVRIGARVKVLYRTTGGGLVLSVDGARIAIDSRLACSIHVEPVHG